MAKRRADRLYTLSEVAAKTGISLASLRRYREAAAERIPSAGEGRQQRYPEAALEVFRALKEEGMARRGRQRKGAGSGRAAGAPPAGGKQKRAVKRGATRRAGARRGTRPARGRKATGAGAAVTDRDQLLTLVQIGQMTGISYPTLLRYVRLHLDRLPHTGSGRKRRFRPGAVAVFQQLRGESRRGRRPGSRTATGAAPSLARDLARLERGQRELARGLRDLRKEIRRPFRIKLER